jgi:hypothetical protein
MATRASYPYVHSAFHVLVMSASFFGVKATSDPFAWGNGRGPDPKDPRAAPLLGDTHSEPDSSRVEATSPA